MFCPRCGQEQASENTRFCSRCGFLLNTVAEVLVNGGVLPQLLELQEKKTIFTRRNGVLFSVFWFIFFTLIMTSVGGILDFDELAGLSAIIGVFGSIMLLIASLTVLKKPAKSPANFANQPQKNLYSGSPNALPPQQTQPVESYVAPANDWKAPNTGELLRPPSVTEDTTKLLQKDEK